ncbi:tetratricopeptide repeat (TPR)-like superfamily protein [Wolffia australiana]
MASSIDSPLRQMLVDEIAPVVMVLSSELAEQCCRKNGLNFVEMIRPFSIFENIDVPVRTASDQPYRLQEFRLRIFYASDIYKKAPEVADNLLEQVVSDRSDIQFPDSNFNYLQPGGKPSGGQYKLGRQSAQPPWFQTFNRELLRTLSFSEHEAFDYPVACLLVVSTLDEQPLSKFADLFNADQLPSLLNEGIMDPKILKHYLLLHDNQNEDLERVGSMLAEMRSTFGSEDSHLLCINSSQTGLFEGHANPWVHNKGGEILKPDNSCYLSDEDTNEIKDLMQDLCSKCIIPFMEHKIRDLNQQVAAIRKGFKNQIKNLWWRKGKEDTIEHSKGPLYTFNSIESQIRVLGDYAFMLCDYELALSNYRLLSSDYKIDKAWKHYSGAQEMSGLCLFMLDQSRKEAEYFMDNAFNSYERIGSATLRYATRCGIWWAEMFKDKKMYREAAVVYFRIASQESSLNAAVMLEQAAYCYLRSDPPMLRKYAFHLVLAGNRYSFSEQKKHAIRAYTSALSVYKEDSWSYINDHVQFNIGRLYRLIDMLDIAIGYMVEVLACSRQSPNTQKIFLNDFLRVVQSTGSKPEVKMLQLPLIKMPSLKVAFEDHRTYASPASVYVSESLWKKLEEDMVPSVYSIKSNWLESYNELNAFKKSKEYAICVVGEPIKVYLEFKNPLQISISLSDVSLICEHSTSPKGKVLDDSPSASTTPDEEPQDDAGFGENKNTMTSFVLSRTHFTLGGGETRGEELKVTPRSPGILKIIGVRWVVSDSFAGSYMFQMETQQTRRKPKGREDFSNLTLTFLAIKGLPKLEGSLHGLPEKTYAGDMRLVMLELKNKSDYPVKNLKMKISHPRFLKPGCEADMNLTSTAWSEKNLSSLPNNSEKAMMFTSDENMKGPFSFPNVSVIEGGTVLRWPLWFHAGVSGTISQYISLYYEMESNVGGLTYRTLRMHYRTEVLPSLDISISITRSPIQSKESLLRMDIVNLTQTENFLLRELLAVYSDSDVLENLSYASSHLSKLLLAGQSVVCLFKLKGNNQIKLLPSHGSCAEAVPEDDSGLISNRFKLSLLDFHCRERLHQESVIQGFSSAPDVILISQQAADCHPNDTPQIFSHHFCRCNFESKSPIWWQLSGPPSISHDFASSFYETELVMTLHNFSPATVTLKIVVPEHPLSRTLSGESTDDLALSNYGHGGWQDVPLASDVLSSALQSARLKKPLPLSLSLSGSNGQPFAWCTSTSSSLILEPKATVEVPMRVCIFSAGLFDLSNLELHWSMNMGETKAEGADAKSNLLGMSRGSPFFLTARQATG